MTQNYHNTVFINCPYDDEYNHILKPIIYVLVKAGMYPIFASDVRDSGNMRLERIFTMIKSAKFSIHDLSAIYFPEDEPARFNMPFECGIDFGCRYYLPQEYGDKKFLILEEKKHSLRPAFSDINGVDPSAHNNCGEQAAKIVRNWAVSNFIPREERARFPSGRRLHNAFTDFLVDHIDYLINEEMYTKEEALSQTRDDFVLAVTYLDRTSL